MALRTRSRGMRFWLFAATLLSGLLAGADLDRALVAMPAWQTAGPEAWAVFSRNADLGNGLVLYPLEAIGGALLILVAIVAFYLGAREERGIILFLFAALALSIVGLLL